MSQIIKNSSGGGSSGIATIYGDTGSISGSSVTIYADQTANNSGQTVLFVNSGTISTFNVTDVNGNTTIGNLSGNAGMVHAEAQFNTSLGKLSLGNISDGSFNTILGYEAGTAMTGDGLNVAVGALSMYLASNSDENTAVGYKTLLVTTGSNNIALGYQAGINYVSSESSNIVIGNSGTASESNVTRIGTQGSSTGQQNKCFIAGIVGVAALNPELITINSSTGQLGVQALTQYNVLTGGASNAVNVVAPSSTSGVPLISQGSSSQPTYGTAVVAGGGTGDTSFTAYSVICGGTTSTGALQNVSGVGTSGQVLTSNGASELPTWQAAGGGGAGQDSFLAYLSSVQSNKTGNGANFQIIFDTAPFNNGGYSTSTGIFTAPATGIYSFSTTVLTQAQTTSLPTLELSFIATSRTITNRSDGIGTTSGQNIPYQLTSLIDMTEGDTCYVNLNIAGSGVANSTGVYGASGVYYTIFSGFRVA